MSTIFGRLLQNRLTGIEESFKDSEVQAAADIKGDAAEIQLRALIAEFVPPHVGVARGWIFDSQDRRTNERDIIVYSKNKAPSFLFDISSGLIPAESVLYDIEVKSTAKESNLRSELKAIRNHSTPRVGRNVVVSMKYVANRQNLLSLYESIDSGFLTKPSIDTFVCGGAGYFYFNVEKCTLGSIFSEDKFLAAVNRVFPTVNIPEATEPRKLFVNGHNIDVLRTQEISIHSWRGFHEQSFRKCVTGFLQGFSNTLFESEFGRYLHEYEINLQTFSVVILDQNGKQIFKKVDLTNGLEPNYKELLTWSLEINKDESIVLAAKEREG